jgi:hypothetical protein
LAYRFIIFICLFDLHHGFVMQPCWPRSHCFAFFYCRLVLSFVEFHVNGSIHNSSCLASFARLHAFKIHPCYCMYQSIPFWCCIVF